MSIKSKASLVIILLSTILHSNTYINDNLSQNLQVSPLFSDPSTYNSYDFCNYPYGYLNKDSITLKVTLGTHINRWYSSQNNDSLVHRYTSFSAPEFSIGVPQKIMIQLRYMPQLLSFDPSSSNTISLPLHTFGISFAAQLPSQYFKVAFNFDGFTGNEKQSSSNSASQSASNSRMIIGVNDLSLSLGSRVHKFVEIGMKGGITALLDTLKVVNDTNDTLSQNIKDRYFTGEIPDLSWFIDVGDSEFPVESNLLLSTSTNHFIYVTEENVDANPIKSKNLAFKTHLTGNIPLSSLMLHPSIQIGYWQKKYQIYEPTENNDNLDVGDKIENRNWDLTDFYFGVGSSVLIHSFLSVWLEYTNANINQKSGSYWTNADQNDRYHHTSAGLDILLHAIPQLNFPSSIETTIKTGYVNRTVNNYLYTLSDKKYNTLNKILWSNSQAYRYTPDLEWNNSRITCFSIGLQSSFFDRKFGFESFINIPNQTAATSMKGLDFSFNITYKIP